MNLILIGIIILVVAVIISARGGFESFNSGHPWTWSNTEKLFLGNSTKCFSCEKHLMSIGLSPHMGQPTKCVNCEAQMSKAFGHEHAHLGKNTKCLSCAAVTSSKFGEAGGNAINTCNPSAVGIIKGFGGVSGGDLA